MKKFTLTSLFLLACASMSFAQGYDAQLKWYKVLDAGDKVMSNVNAICAAPDGDFYVAGNFSASKTVAWGDTNITPATELTFDSQKDVMLARMDAEGNLVWNVVPSYANTANNYLFVAQASDGGMLVAAEACCNKNGAGYPELMKFTDATGHEVTINYPEGLTIPEGKSGYVALVMKFAADGTYLWSQALGGAYTYDKDGKETFESTPVKVRGLCAGDGLVFISGTYVTSIIYNGETWAEALNTAAEGGSGDAYVAAFYEEAGECGGVIATGIFTEDPYAASESVTGIAYNEGLVYVAALVTPLADKPYNFFGKPVELLAEKNNIVYGAITLEDGCSYSADVLTPKSLNDKAINAMLQGIDLDGNTLYISGSIQGELWQGERMLVAGADEAKLSGLCAAIDVQTMKAISAGSPKATIGNIYSAVTVDGGEAYCGFGYVMATSEASIYKFSTATGEMLSQTNLFGGSGATNAWYFDAETDTLFGTSYSKGVTVEGTEIPTYSSFHGYLMAYSISGMSGIAAPAAINAANGTTVYYNLQGMRIANPAAGQLVIRHNAEGASKVVIR